MQRGSVSARRRIIGNVFTRSALHRVFNCTRRGMTRTYTTTRKNTSTIPRIPRRVGLRQQKRNYCQTNEGPQLSETNTHIKNILRNSSLNFKQHMFRFFSEGFGKSLVSAWLYGVAITSPVVLVGNLFFGLVLSNDWENGWNTARCMTGYTFVAAFKASYYGAFAWVTLPYNIFKMCFCPPRYTNTPESLKYIFGNRINIRNPFLAMFVPTWSDLVGKMIQESEKKN